MLNEITIIKKNDAFRNEGFQDNSYHNINNKSLASQISVFESLLHFIRRIKNLSRFERIFFNNHAASFWTEDRYCNTSPGKQTMHTMSIQILQTIPAKKHHLRSCRRFLIHTASAKIHTDSAKKSDHLPNIDLTHTASVKIQTASVKMHTISI